MSYLRRIAVLERELVAFLQHYTASRRGERPWRLVINGDMVDFMSVQIAASADDQMPDDERAYGIGHSEAQSLRKLDRVITRHAVVIDALAAFVAAGNELVIVVGNHDVEFHYEGVQRRMIDALAERGAPRAQIRFCDWFYYEDQVVYVEHGHQYDEYCSFDYQLHPATKGSGLALTVAHAGVRYFINAVPEMDPHSTESMGMLDYARFGWAQGARGLARVALLYAQMIRKMFEIWAFLTDRQVDAARAEDHRRRLRVIAGEYRLAVEQVESLDGLRRLPVLKRFHMILVAMFLDRILLGLLVLLGMGAALLLVPDGYRLGGAALVLGGGVVVNQLLGRLRVTDSALLLRRVPAAIRAILQAPLIVFGHSHRAEEVQLDGGARYFNTGTWLSYGELAQEAFTHLVITVVRGRPEQAALYQWRDGAPARIDPRRGS